MPAVVLGFQDVDRTDGGLVGGKGANLGELSRIEGICVPDGFCVSTDAFQRMLHAASIGDSLERLAQLKAEDQGALRELAAAIRGSIEGTAIPEDLRDAITRGLAKLGAEGAYAVRSSATAEDLPGASFAGQQDTYLNVVGAPAILEHIRKCWASLFTERAIAYRIQHGFDHRKVQMAVVVQTMLAPQASGVLFTADPIHGNRNVASVEAVFGLGDALVSGLATPDGYRVRDAEITHKGIVGDRPVLTDAQILRLVRVGRQLEAHFKEPQDIEWCFVDDEPHIVQSRPITTVFPIPEIHDGRLHVYISVGHQQMMTDAMKPLGLSMWQLIAMRPMSAAGGRLFVDVSEQLASPDGRAMLLNLASSDPLIKDALATVVERMAPADPAPPSPSPLPGPPPAGPDLEDDPAIVAALIARSQAAVEALKKDIRTKSGPDLMAFLMEDIQRLKQSLMEPPVWAAIMAGMNATSWINEHLFAWLGEKSAADTLTQSVPNNVTSEMGLALLDVADVVRPCPEVVRYLELATDDGFLEGLLPLEGGPQVLDALRGFLDRYGMRCVGEIDITRPRWAESPTALVSLILGNVRNFEAGAGPRKFERGRQEASKKEQELLARLKQHPDGERKATEAQRMIHRLRTFMGYREYPKYHIVQRIFVYKQALLTEADRLVGAGLLETRDDMDYLTFRELEDVLRTHELDAQLIAGRKAEHERNRKRSPPRVLLSDGEIVRGAYKRANLPEGALVGLAVSSGVVEGRARVLSDLADGELEAGDILVTAFTDPSWTPVFVTIRGLVTEVGGLMTHGAVIAREYGLPAVVGVENATRLIRDGQRIRVHGTEGYVELLGIEAT